MLQISEIASDHTIYEFMSRTKILLRYPFSGALNLFRILFVTFWIFSIN